MILVEVTRREGKMICAVANLVRHEIDRQVLDGLIEFQFEGEELRHNKIVSLYGLAKDGWYYPDPPDMIELRALAQALIEVQMQLFGKA